MYQGKYSKTSRYSKKRTNKRKVAVLLTSLVLVLVCFVGSTVAYLVASTGMVTNTFNPAQVSCRVDEKSFDGAKKENVTIANTSNMDISFFPIMNILSVNHWISLPKNLTFGQKFYILVTEYHHPHVFSPNILRNVDTISLFWSTI